MTPEETRVREAFAKQAVWCRKLGSPFTALLCEVTGRRLDRRTAVGRRMLEHEGEPDATGDAVPLRFAGGLHALVRSGEAPSLAAHYPSNPTPAPDDLWREIEIALSRQETTLMEWLEHAPQTNEVARSAILMAGLLVIAETAPMPARLYELGASAGLNLMLDRYRYRFGVCSFGPADAEPVLAPEWRGPPPPLRDIEIAWRRGVDLNPLDAGKDGDRLRLMSYIWPDQPERLARMEAALDVAAAARPAIDRGDAVDWLERILAEPARPGTARVAMHSIAAQYFPESARARVASLLKSAGHQATPKTPLYWLRFELDPEAGGKPALRLTAWPDGQDRLLAVSHSHCEWVEWCE